MCLHCLPGPLRLSRPLVTFDIESTGTDVTNDRIVEIAAIKLMPDGEVKVQQQVQTVGCMQAHAGQASWGRAWLMCMPLTEQAAALQRFA